MERVAVIENVPANCPALAITCCLVRKIENLEHLRLRSLDLYRNLIARIEGLDSQTELEYLDLAFNKLRKIENLEHCRKLKQLFLNSNEIARIENLDTLTALETLELGSNQIQTVENLGALRGLRELWLGRNRLSSMQLRAQFPQLRILSLQCNRIAKWDASLVANCPNLEELYVSQNPITELPEYLAALKSLRLLDASASKVSDVRGLSHNSSIEELWLNDSRLASLDDVKVLQTLPKLRVRYVRAVRAQRINEIEFEISRTQKNKATEYHIGRLKAQLAKYRSQLISEANASAGAKGEGFDVQRFGHARIALLGFPSVGKSTILNSLTNTKSEVAGYEFTTLTCVPGVVKFRDATLQLLDLPGIIEGAAQGKGRGKQVIAVARSADLILMVLDPLRKLCNAEVLFKGDYDLEDLIDTLEGNRRYVKCLYVYNKVDMLSLEQISRLATDRDAVCISSNRGWNLDLLLELIWARLRLARVYTKKAGEKPDFEDPVILTEARGGFSVRAALAQIHTGLVTESKYALVWGVSVKHVPQQVGLDHRLADEDVLQVFK
uniref:Developmentally-regulated G-protein 2-like n=1 Tax=Dermatophagoides pteronyssinus TaxID=6956 RepID=A0A6P6Y4L7_DERPT|nr:developmentally-regulated G-protein 2-like [Dermatophagoides pteronyssinus]